MKFGVTFLYSINIYMYKFYCRLPSYIYNIVYNDRDPIDDMHGGSITQKAWASAGMVYRLTVILIGQSDVLEYLTHNHLAMHT